ncbi:hypothetical protein KCP76_06090 [Salmonella enterica subsp. enterica serovar Weltevreden]|nr:hypothetical protein KCP76_06090 [Salmonella enterica subsp. enterica serovar Weltevreden]
MPRRGTPVTRRRSAAAVDLWHSKLGGGESNFRSDIDLIFAPAVIRYIRGGVELDNAQFYAPRARLIVYLAVFALIGCGHAPATVC